MKIQTQKCTGCGGCVNLCPAAAISFIGDSAFIEEALCTECGLCAQVCAVEAPTKEH